jgi:hypothetical protein
MRNGNWSTSENKALVSSCLPPCPANGFIAPDLKKVATEIRADDEDFLPEYGRGENAAELLANIPEGKMSIASGMCEIVDCGFSLKIPAGYKCAVSSNIPSLFLSLIGSERIRLNVFNAGDHMVLQHKQSIGKIWIEPVYLFEWITKGAK